MSFKPLVLATALAVTLPGAVSAFSMRCDDPGQRLSSPFASGPGRYRPSYRRPELPNWVNDRRSRYSDRGTASFSPIERPALPDWVRERRSGHSGRVSRPELPEWVQARQAARPAFVPGYGSPRFERAGPGDRAAPADGTYSGRFRPTGLPPWGGPPGFARPAGLPAWRAPAWVRRPYRPFGYPYPWALPPAVVMLPAAPATPPPESAPEPAPESVVRTEPAPKPEPAPVDSDRDGVLSPADLCPDSAAGVAVDAFGCEQNAAIVLRGVQFKTDSAELTGDSLAILDAVSETLVAHPEIRVEVAGHTDSDGDDAYNKDLSQRRSESVVAYLTGKGVMAENLTARGYGEEQPVAGNDTVEGKALNRRVELNRI